jgi:hypothetical protein
MENSYSDHNFDGVNQPFVLLNVLQCCQDVILGFDLFYISTGTIYRRITMG